MGIKESIARAETIMRTGCPNYTGEYIREMLGPILYERAEREKNPGVWDGAPDDADTVTVTFYVKGRPVGGPARIRELPKTKAREIAERYSCDTATCHPMIDGNRAVDVIESAILEALQSEGKK